MSEIKRYFKKNDPIIFSILESADVSSWQRPAVSPELYFHTLANSIISQQLNTKVADIISDRLLKALQLEQFTAEALVAADISVLRSMGLSQAKANYIQSLAELSSKNQINFKIFSTASEEEIIEELIKVKGIGRWTAEMFLMFALGRPDVFSYGDYGLKSALRNLYKLDDLPSKEQAAEITDKWRPYRTIGSLALWKSLEKKG